MTELSENLIGLGLLCLLFALGIVLFMQYLEVLIVYYGTPNKDGQRDGLKKFIAVAYDYYSKPRTETATH